MQAHTADPCCGCRISKAMREGKLDTADKWECPKCQMEWRPEETNGVRIWSPKVYFEVLRKR